MAPNKRSSIRAKATAKAERASRPALPFSQPIKPTRTTSTSDDALFPNSKRDKAAIKHSSFVSKIEKKSSTTKKRSRRANKQLVANLESLADALPEASEGTGEGEGGDVVIGQARIQRKSLKSRPGAMKRKEKVERMERERFQKNLVQMSGASAVEDRWRALKEHVRSTVEVKAEFAGK